LGALQKSHRNFPIALITAIESHTHSCSPSSWFLKLDVDPPYDGVSLYLVDRRNRQKTIESISFIHRCNLTSVTTTFRNQTRWNRCDLRPNSTPAQF